MAGRGTARANAASANMPRVSSEIGRLRIKPCSTSAAVITSADATTVSERIPATLPCIKMPGLKMKKNGSTKPPTDSMQAYGASLNGLAPAMAAAAKAATATGGVMAERLA